MKEKNTAPTNTNSCEVLKTEYTFYFIFINTFKSNARMKLAKKQAKTKQYPELELLLFENYALFSFTLSSKK